MGIGRTRSDIICPWPPKLSRTKLANHFLSPNCPSGPDSFRCLAPISDLRQLDERPSVSLPIDSAPALVISHGGEWLGRRCVSSYGNCFSKLNGSSDFLNTDDDDGEQP